MTVGPRRRDFELRDNADFSKVIGCKEPGGRGIDDLVLTNGDTSVTSATAGFTAEDEGTKLATADGSGITDGTTIATCVSPTEVLLSAPATATLTHVVAVVRALNTSAFSSLGAQYRHTPFDPKVRMAFTVDESRKAVGLWVISASKTLIAASVTQNGVWDWPLHGPDGDMPWYFGKIIFTKGVTR